MSQFYLINTVILANGTKLLAGEFVDDAVTPSAPITAAGGILWPASDTVVAAAGVAVAAKHANRGINESEANDLMIAAVENSIRGTNSGAAASIATLQGQQIQKVTCTITQAADLAGLAGGVTSFNKNIGAALPANARIIGYELTGFTGFDDATHATYTAKAGGASSTDLISTANVTTGQTGFPKPGTAGALGYAGAPQGGQQLVANISTTVNLNTATVGAITFNVYYAVMPA